MTVPARSRIRVAADRDGLDRVFHAYETFAKSHRMPDAVRRDVYVALEELVSNVVRHGVTDRTPTIEMTLAVDNGVFTVGITDDGPAFDPFTSAPVPDVTQALMDRPIGGLGVLFVQQLTDAHSYERRGDRNCVTLTRAIGRPRRARVFGRIQAKALKKRPVTKARNYESPKARNHETTKSRKSRSSRSSRRK